jgi:drug/metabolite transporter (DMT)-like permease
VSAAVLGGLLALLASLCWGTSDFLAGLEARRSTAWGVALIGQAVAAVGAVGLLALVAPVAPSPRVLAALILGGLSSAVGVYAGYRALAVAKMSVVAPIYAGAAVVPVLWGLAAGEQPGALQLAGVVATLVGIALISRPGPEAPGERLPVDRAGVALALVAAVGLGFMLVALDYGASADASWSVAVVRGTAAVCIGAALGAARPALRLRRAAAPLLLAVGLLILAANALFAAATTMGDLSVVGVLGWLGPAVIVIWARVLLRERLRRVQWFAAALVLAGVVCLSVG